jgi:hypothetical protein
MLVGTQEQSSHTPNWCLGLWRLICIWQISELKSQAVFTCRSGEVSWCPFVGTVLRPEVWGGGVKVINLLSLTHLPTVFTLSSPPCFPLSLFPLFSFSYISRLILKFRVFKSALQGTWCKVMVIPGKLC